LSREIAILTIASGGSAKSLDVDDLEALAELADDDAKDLAGLLRPRSRA